MGQYARKSDNRISISKQSVSSDGIMRRGSLPGLGSKAQTTSFASGNARTGLSISLISGNGCKIGVKHIALLEAIQAQGSISGAARTLSLSYRGARRRAWATIVDDVGAVGSCLRCRLRRDRRTDMHECFCRRDLSDGHSLDRRRLGTRHRPFGFHPRSRHGRNADRPRLYRRRSICLRFARCRGGVRRSHRASTSTDPPASTG